MKFSSFAWLLLLFMAPHFSFGFNPATTSVSVVTCGPGNEIYATYGHSAIRIYDSVSGEDIVYNYGTFDGYDPDFVYKFVKGKLLYFVEEDNFSDFITEYRQDGRSVITQEMNLTPEQKNDIIHFLRTNALPAHRYYLYDFLYDNCSTRIRDVFTTILGKELAWGRVPDIENKTFRSQINAYLGNAPWERLGINLLLGSRIDVIMTQEQSMFLPQNLLYAVGNARLNGQRLLSHQKVLQSQTLTITDAADWPLWTMIAVLVVVNIVFMVRKLDKLKPVIAFLLLLSNGLLGCFMLFMWFGTNHQACTQNWNLLWALPWNCLLAFTIFKPRGWHKPCALFSILLLIAVLAINVCNIQTISLPELFPLFVAYLYIYFWMMKNADKVRVAKQKQQHHASLS